MLTLQASLSCPPKVRRVASVHPHPLPIISILLRFSLTNGAQHHDERSATLLMMSSRPSIGSDVVGRLPISDALTIVSVDRGRGLRGPCTLVCSARKYKLYTLISLLARSRSASEQNVSTSDNDILQRCLCAVGSFVRLLLNQGAVKVRRAMNPAAGSGGVRRSSECPTFAL